MRHSPTPWTTNDNGQVDGYAIILDATGTSVAIIANHNNLSFFSDERESGNDNLDFAIHAVNCHDELVAALEDMKHLAYKFAKARSTALGHCGLIAKDLEDRLLAADAALANARQTPTEKEPRP